MTSYPKNDYSQNHEKLGHETNDFQYHVIAGSSPVMSFVGHEVNGQILYDTQTQIFTIRGQFSHTIDQKLRYWAANPIPRMYSYPGSGLPFPNPEVAYENTPNQGDIDIDHLGHFEIKLQQPAGYYIQQGKILVKPHIHFQVQGQSKILTMSIADDFPNRSLTGLSDRPNRTIGR